MISATKKASRIVKAVEETASHSGLGLKPLEYSRVTITIKGVSPLVQHKWSEKALRQMREKHAGKKTKDRDVRDPKAEAKAATYFTAKGKPGIPAMAIKTAIIDAAHKDLGIEKTLVRKAIFLDATDPKLVLPMEFERCEECVEDLVRVGAGQPDLRYRPYFYGWSCRVSFLIETNLIRVEDFLTLVGRAGLSLGIGEMRPQNGGEYGRFDIDDTQPVEVKGV